MMSLVLNNRAQELTVHVLIALDFLLHKLYLNPIFMVVLRAVFFYKAVVMRGADYPLLLYPFKNVMI